MDLRELQKLVFKEYVKNGYLKFWSSKTVSESKKSNIAELGFISQEIGEAIEIVFKDSSNLKNVKNYEKLGLECIDIVIRTLNFMSRLGLDADFNIITKNNINQKRGYLHAKTE
jgi:hypothetical protein